MHNKAVHGSNRPSEVGFTFEERYIKNPHKFQLYVDYGHTSMGPWVKFGVNSTEFGVGYLPNPLKTVEPQQTVSETAAS